MSTLKRVFYAVVLIVLIPVAAVLIDVVLEYGRLVGTIGRIIHTM